MSVDTTTPFRINQTLVTATLSEASALTGTTCGVVNVHPAVGVVTATVGGVMSMITVTDTTAAVERFPVASTARAVQLWAPLCGPGSGQARSKVVLRCV